MARVLLTGLTGFIGGYLAKHLLDSGHEVWGMRRWRTSPANLVELRIAENPALHVVEGDVLDQRCVRELVDAARPGLVFHLAAQSYPKESWSAPWYTMETNVQGTLALLEAIRTSPWRPRIHIPGSAAQYGQTMPEENPVLETQPFRPSSPYAVSKCAQELLALQYHRSYGLDVVVTRSFIHTGPGQGDRCVLQTFSKQVALIEAGAQEPVLRVGNLSPVRDFTDVRDVAQAFSAVLEKGKPGEAYNVGSGVGTRISDLLDMVRGNSDAPAEVKVDPSRLRPMDEPIMVGDIAKITGEVGWKPSIPLKQTVADVTEDWRRRVKE